MSWLKESPFWINECWKCLRNPSRLAAHPPEFQDQIRFMLAVPGYRAAKVALRLVSGEVVDGICPETEARMLATGQKDGFQVHADALVGLLIEGLAPVEYRRAMTGLGMEAPGEEAFTVPLTLKFRDIAHVRVVA
jgi:hypothetical protein